MNGRTALSSGALGGDATWRPANEFRVKCDAFPFQKNGTAQGDIAMISADAFRPVRNDAMNTEQPRAEADRPYHKARVARVDTSLRDTPTIRLLPGMTVTAEIKAGTRRVISCLLYPILRGLDESPREPR